MNVLPQGQNVRMDLLAKIGQLKNKIINGNFDLWQRGPSFSGFGIYYADRWRASTNTDDTISVTRQAFTLGQTDVPGEPEFFIRSVLTAGVAGTLTDFRQKIESVRSLAGQTVTISFYAKASVSSTLTANSRLVQDFGTGGSPSSTVNHNIGPFSLTTAWQRFTEVVKLTSISGKTLGTGGNDFLDIVLSLPVNTTVDIDIAQCQVEKGSGATDFEQRPIGLELALAQRYYQKTFPIDVAPAQNTGQEGAITYRISLAGVSNQTFPWFHKTVMRAVPTILTFNPGAANANWRNVSDAGDSGVPVIEGPSNDLITYIRNPQVSTDGVTELMEIHATADAEL